MKYFPRIRHIAALQRSPRVPVKMSIEPEDFTGRIIFMSMCNDFLWRSEDNERECNANADPDGTAKFSGRDYEFREPTLRREQTVRSEDFSGDLQGEPGES